MSDTAKTIYSFIEPIEEIRLRVFRLHDRKDLQPNVQSLIHEVGDALEDAKEFLLDASKAQASQDFLKEVGHGN